MHGRRQQGSGGVAPLDFHTCYKYSRERLKSVNFRCFFAIFRSFFRCLPPGRGSIVLFFRLFCYFLVFFSVAPSPGNFSADALEYVAFLFVSSLVLATKSSQNELYYQITGIIKQKILSKRGI